MKDWLVVYVHKEQAFWVSGDSYVKHGGFSNVWPDFDFKSKSDTLIQTGVYHRKGLSEPTVIFLVIGTGIQDIFERKSSSIGRWYIIRLRIS